MREINISEPKDESFKAQLLALYETFQNIRPGEKVNFNLDNINWIFPLLILPITAYIKHTGSTYTIGDAHKTKDYLDAIHFPLGIDSVDLFQNATQRLKSYVPISILKMTSPEQRERLETSFLEMVFKILAPNQGAMNAIYYPVGELVGNIFEHSKEKEGYVLGQFYPKKNYLDMCIVDCGRGLVKTYSEEKHLNLQDDEAIVQALEGNSTKANTERGYGVRTSRRVICEGLKGEFAFISGQAVFLSYNNEKYMLILPQFNWQGVIVAYRIPKPEQPVDIGPYIE